MTKEQEEFAQLLNWAVIAIGNMSDEKLATIGGLNMNQLAKKPSTVMRTYTQQVRDHTSAMARLQDQYFAALKRAEAQYFEGVKRITEAVTQATEPTAEVSETEAPPPTQ